VRRWKRAACEIELLGPRPPRDFPGTRILTAPSFLDVHDIQGDHRHIGMIYFARSHGAELRLAEQEHHAIRWFTPEELVDPQYGVDEAIRFYAEAALAAVRENDS
jgi:hypothetical protein